MSHIADLCRSSPHRAVLGLLSQAMEEQADPSLVQDLSASDPADIIAVATFASVHTMLASAFDDDGSGLGAAVDPDLLIYLREMRRANSDRNAAVLENLQGLKGRGMVALKGAASLLTGTHGHIGHRFLSDVDLLASREDAKMLWADLVANAAAIDEGSAGPGHHHLPRLTPAGWEVPLEIHIKVGRDEVDDILPAVDVLTRAPGIGAVTPAHIEDRLIHLVVHAMFINRALSENALPLRDVVEFRRLWRGLDRKAASAIESRLKARSLLKGLDALKDVAAILFDGDVPATDWGRSAVSAFGDPKRRRRAYVARELAGVGHALLTRPGAVVRKIADTRGDEGLKAHLAHHRDRLRRMK